MGNAIFLSDDEETILAKVKTTVTDTARVTLKDKGNPEVCIVSEYLLRKSLSIYRTFFNTAVKKREQKEQKLWRKSKKN